MLPVAGNALGLTGEYEAREFCDLIHAETATVLATYGADFYAGRPALTVNELGQGQAYYIASRNDERFLDDFYAALAAAEPAARPGGRSAGRRHRATAHRRRAPLRLRDELQPGPDHGEIWEGSPALIY